MASTHGVQLDAKETSYRAEILLHLRLCRGLRVGGGGTLPEKRDIWYLQSASSNLAFTKPHTISSGTSNPWLMYRWSSVFTLDLDLSKSPEETCTNRYLKYIQIFVVEKKKKNT